MAAVVITYETLFDLLRTEKGRPELQQLPEDFYGQLVAYLRKKEADVAAAGGPASGGAQKALVQYRNVQKILRELHERRERKIIEMALNRARAESNIIDTAPLLREEQEFYARCAELFSEHRKALLASVLAGEAPAGTRIPEPPAGAAPAEAAATESGPAKEEAAVDGGDREMASPEAVAALDSCRVRFLAEVPRFLGLKGEVNGPFAPGDTAELPGKIAAVLLKKRRAEMA